MHIHDACPRPIEHALDALRRLHARTSYDANGCWLWGGYVKNSYGALSVGNVDVYIHRLSYEIHHGPIPDGLFVCHRCDVRLCWAPHHLFAGTQQDNVTDCITKGRHVPPPHLIGEENPKVTLSDDDVEAIRALAGSMQQRDIAQAFGVSQSTVWRLIHRHTRVIQEVS